MPNIYPEQLGIAIGDVLNRNFGDWNRDFRDAIQNLDGENSKLTISAEMTSDPDETFPIEIVVKAVSDQTFVTGVAVYVDHGTRDRDTPVHVN